MTPMMIRSRALFTLFILQQRMPVCSWLTTSTSSISTNAGVRRYGSSSFSSLSAVSPPIHIGVDSHKYSVHDFSLPKQYVESGELSSIMIPHGMISDRIRKIAADIIQSSDGISNLHMLCVLKGGARFFNDLTAYMQDRIRDADLDLRLTFEFVKIRSYSGTKSTGTVEVQGLSDKAIKGKDVILVEDIIDSGNTLRKVIPVLQSQQPRSLRVASLLVKRVTNMDKPGYDADFAGFSIPDSFVVGFNMDYNEVYRDLPHLCILSQVGIDKWKDAA